jgi:hypothetical protein
MYKEAKSLSVPQWKLRRIAGRALRVLDDHGPHSAIIASYDTSVRAAVATFVQAHDALAVRSTDVHALGRTSNHALGALLRAMRGWVGVVARDLPGFAPLALPDHPTPDDLLAQTDQLLEVVQQLDATATWRDALVNDLEALLERSRDGLHQLRTGRATVQALQARNREAGAALQAQLVPFRRSLRAVLGPSHLDYQSLRVSRVRDTDDADRVVESVAESGAQSVAESVTASVAQAGNAAMYAEAQIINGHG